MAGMAAVLDKILSDVAVPLRASLGKLDREIVEREDELEKLRALRQEIAAVVLGIDGDGGKPASKPKRRRRSARRPGATVDEVYAWITANVEPEGEVTSPRVAEALGMERASVGRALGKLAEDGRLRFDRRELAPGARGRPSRVYRLVELGTV